MKNLSIKTARMMINDKENKTLNTYPEFKEDGSCSWSELKLTEKNLAKLIEEGTLSYLPCEDRFIPTSFYKECLVQF